MVRHVSFDVGADAYARFMGRYSELLAVEFAAAIGVEGVERALDVGCGPGAMTAELVRRLGTAAVTAIDPSESFVAAVRARLPEVDVRLAVAEVLPFDDDQFDLAVAALVVHFMTDPIAGLAEMARVTRPGGRIAACVWDQAGGTGPLSVFWRAVADVDPSAEDESALPGTREGQLAELFARAGLEDVQAGVLTVRSRFATFEEWWDTFTLGVGPAGAYVTRLDGPGREQLRARCSALLPVAPFEITASAWTAIGRV
jgi:SAM-dependent methyltransferase